MDGSVDREIVLFVLKAHGVSVSDELESGAELGPKTTMVKGDTVEVHFLPPKVPRRIVHRLGHKFEVPRHFFWRPDMLRDEDMPEEASPN